MNKSLAPGLTWRTGLLIGLVLLLTLLAYKAWRIGSLALSLKARLDRVQAASGRFNLASLLPLVSEARAATSELHALRSELAPLLAICPYLGGLPGYGADVEAAPALMDMAVEVADAGDLLLASLEPQLAALPEGGLSISHAVRMIQTVQPALGQARAHLDRAVQARARIVRPLSPRLAPWLAKVDKALPLAVTAADAAGLAPHALGLDGRHIYLVLAQNSDELRPTGGFISSVGRVAIENGAIISQTFEDSYAVDDFRFPYPDSPPELLTYMGSEMWVFRDSNWSPDFPTSARDAVRLYQIGRPGRVDGVIAINMQAIPVLFDALGPIGVPGFDQPVTGQTVVAAMRQALLSESDAQSGEWWKHRKDFMGAVASAVLARVQSGLTAEQAARLVQALLEVLERRDVLIYLDWPEGQRLLGQRRWDGAVQRPAGDFLMVVDTNMGFNKVNPNVGEQLAYTVQLDEAGAGRATLVITHTSRARPEAACNPEPRYDPTYEGMMNRCYWDFVRAYAPLGSTLITATLQAPAPLVGQRWSDGRPAVTTDLGCAVFGSFFALNGGRRQVTRFEYSLPPVVSEEAGVKVYSLYVQRQPAAGDWPLEIAVWLPPGASALRTDPPARAGQGPALRWSLRLSADRQVRVWFAGQ